MNTSYRSLWNAALASWVAVPETACAHGGASRAPGLLSAMRLTTLALALSSAWATPAAAATLYWDINGVTPGLGGAGTWNTTNNFWNTSANGTGGTPSIWNNGALDDAVFDGAAGAVVVTLGTPITVHNLRFGVSPSYALSGSTLTLAGSTPIVDTLGNTHTIGSVVAGTAGLIKAGAGALALTGSNTYTGPTTVSTGTLSVGSGGSTGAISSASAIAVAGGATMQWNNANNLANNVLANTLTGTGTVRLQGQNATAALQTSVYDVTGDWSGFAGELILNRAILWNTTAPSQVGTGTIRVQDRGTMAFNGGTFSNNLVLEAGAGWHHNVGGDAVVGAIRFEGNNTLAGNITLSGAANPITLGDNTGANSTIGSYGGGSQTLSGVISGSGGLAMSRYTSWNGGSVQPVNIDLAGSSSNTYTGTTVVDGQGGVASLRLMKTGGAVAIPANTVVQFGSGTNGQANLRMGGNEQFGAGVVMNWVNAAGQWGRFDLRGTTQTIAGLNSTMGTASMVVQNQGFNDLDPGGDAILTLNGLGTYAAYGYVRDQDNGGITRKLNLVKNGTGMQTLGNQAPGSIQHTGTTTVNAGILVHDTTLSSANAWRSPVTVHAGGEFRTAGTQANQGLAGGSITLDGGILSHTTTAANAWKVWSDVLTVGAAGGTINVNNTHTTNNNLFFDAGIAGAGNLTVNTTGGGNNGIVFRTAAGSYTGNITLDSGTTFINGSAGRTLQNATVNLRNGARLTSTANWSGSATSDAYFGAVNGAAGTNLNTASVFHVGTSNGNGSYSGDITGAGLINKLGTGTQVLNGAATGTTGWLMASKGTLELAAGFSKTTNDLLYVGAYDQARYNDGGAAGIGTMHFTGGNFTSTAVNNYVLWMGNLAGNSGILQMDSGSITGSATSGALIGQNAASTLNQTGGTITLGNQGVLVANLAGAAGSAASFSGGTFSTTSPWFNGVRGSATTSISGTAGVSVGSFNFGHPGGSAAASTLNLTGGTLSSSSGMVYGLGTHAVNLDGGTLRAGSSAFAWAHNANVTANIGASNITFDSQAFNAITAQVLGGAGGITKIGSGSWTLSGANAYTGPTTVNAGTLRAGAAAGGRAFGNLSALSLANVAGAALDLDNFNQAIGSLSGGGAAGGHVTLGSATLTTGGNNTSTSYAGVIAGAGGLIKTGAGIQTLSGASTYTGATAVNAGTLRVNGSLGNTAVGVASGATLGGSGSIAGGVTINAGGTLAPGNSPGTLSMGSLVLDAGALLAYEYGAPNVVGGPSNDLTTAAGNLTLGGTLNIADAGDFARMPGSWRVFNYGGTLTGTAASLALGSTPGYASGDVLVQTAVPGQINLIARQPGLAVNFWDGTGRVGDGVIEGGTETWNNARSNWTNETGNFNQSWVAGMSIFTGRAGTVTLGENVEAMALQFASDGYVVEGAGRTIRLLGLRGGTAPSLIRVDAGATATIAAGLIGSAGLEKGDSGTLVFRGVNSYGGPTMVSGGVLRAGAAGTFSALSAHTVSPGATLDTAGFNQRLAGLANGGTVSLLGAAPGSTLTVTGPYVGNNGVLRLGAVLGATGASDRLVLDGPTATASGRTTLQITNRGGLGGQTTGNGIEVVTALNGATTTAQTTRDAFVLADGGTSGPAKGEAMLSTPHVDAGAFEYYLHAADASGAGENWYLRSVLPGAAPGDPAAPLPGASPFFLPTYRVEVPLFAALPGQLRQSSVAMLGNLHQRIGDDDPRGKGTVPADGGRRAWGRILSADLDLRPGGIVSPSSAGRVNGFHAGTDLLAAPAWRAGLYAGQLDGDASVRGLARGVPGLPVGFNDLRSQYLGLYGTWTGAEGFYADAVLQAGRHRYTVQPTAQFGSSGDGDSLLASIEVGRAFALSDSGWSVEPQLQLIHQRLKLDDSAIVGAQVQQHPDDGWVARLGLRIKGELGTGLGTLQPYGRFNVYRASGGSDVTRFVGPAASTDLASPTGHTSTEVAAGFTLALGPTTTVYGEIGKLFASGGEARLRSGVQGSLGVRMRW